MFRVIILCALIGALSGCASRENLRNAIEALQDSDAAHVEYERRPDGSIHYEARTCKGDPCNRQEGAQ